MKEPIRKHTLTPKNRPGLQQAYNTALLQFQAYLLEKRLVGEARITKSSLIKMISCN